MYYYAQINEEKICVAVSQFTKERVKDNLIPLSWYNTSVLGKRYNDGVWEEVEQPSPEPSQLDRIEAEVKKSQQDIIDEYTLELVEGGII